MATNNGKFAPEHRNPGDIILSDDWNAGMQEIVRLESSKVNREGAESLQGPLTIAEALSVSAISPPTSIPLEIKGALKLAEGVAVNQFSNDSSLKKNSDSIVPTQKAVKTYVDTQLNSFSKKEEPSEVLSVREIAPPNRTPLEIKGALQLAEGIAVNQFSNDSSLKKNSDSIVPTQKAVKTYVDNQLALIKDQIEKRQSMEDKVGSQELRDLISQVENKIGKLDRRGIQVDGDLSVKKIVVNWLLIEEKMYCEGNSRFKLHRKGGDVYKNIYYFEMSRLVEMIYEKIDEIYEKIGDDRNSITKQPEIDMGNYSVDWNDIDEDKEEFWNNFEGMDG